MALDLTSHAIGGIRASGRNGLVCIALGGDGNSHRSLDGGVTWSAIDIDFPDYLSARGVARAGDIWVAVGQSGAISRSIDNGGTWSAVDSGTTSELLSVAVAGGVFVACGTSGALLYSTDYGATWALATHGLGLTTLQTIATDGGVFLVGGYSGKLASSADGATWATITTAGIGTSAVNRVTYGGSRWMVMAQDRKVSLSTNLATWSFVQLPTGSGNPSAGYYANTAWVIGTVGGSVYRSTDGASWTPVYTHPEYTSLAFGDASATQCVMAGSGGVLLLSEDDGATWVAQDPLAGFALHADYSPGGWVIATNSALYTTTEASGAPALLFPLRLTVSPVSPIRLPLRLQIGATTGIAPLAIRLTVIDNAVYGGLNGAGGWASAPSGKWRPVVLLDGVEITQLVGAVVVTLADNEARIARFSFLPVAPIEPMAVVGRRVRIAFAQRGQAGDAIAAQTIFSGVVDKPTIDMDSRVIACDCHDQIQEIVSNTPTDWLDAEIGGRYRDEISGAPASGWDYAIERLASVPRSIALDAMQTPRVIDWRGSGLRNMRVTEADIKHGSLSVQLPNRDELRTRVVVRVQYRYERLRGRGISAQYAPGLRFFTGNRRGGLNKPSVQWLLTGMVESAARGVSGWQLRDLIITNPPAGWTLVGDSEEEGIYVIPPAVAPLLVTAFSARWSTRWLQTVTEDFTVELVLSDLEQAIGPVREEIGVTLIAPFDVSDWERDDSLEPVLSIPVAGDVVTPWQPPGAASSDRDAVIQTMLDRAWVRLYGAARSGRVQFVMPLRPDLWLDWWMEVDTPALRAAGKVVEVTHTLDPESGSATTAVTLAVGLPGNADFPQPDWHIPEPEYPDETRPIGTWSVDVPTHVGGLPTSPPDDQSWTGFITNIDTQSETPGISWYDRRLDLESPAIDSADRDPLNVAVTAEITTHVPTSLLEFI